ncbi:hypothetical protein SORBI_3001G365332 [Sorghum bicolor]|uniref:DUF4371 domain-containing protein n=1 Tax=Sorghum bicolor TaxID=4558 RepID=A0A1Z5S9G7_SORBI|nr:hypothetical protein SORBI_3001G365332 [Sorghum bicolor]
MEPSDCQSRNQTSGTPVHSDESSDAHAADVVMEDLLGPSRKRKIESSSVAHGGDVVMEEPQDGPSHKKVDIHQAIDLMRFVFREGMPFLDNGSGRSFAERMIVDMSGFMVDMMFQDPGISQQNAPGRMWTMTPTLDKDIAHAFAKETRKGIGSVVQGDFYGIFVDTVHIPSTIMSCMVLFVRYLNGKGDVVERLLGVVPDPDFRGSSIKVMVDSMLSEAGLIKECPQFTEKVCSLIQERGLNLASDLKKPGETSWGSYYEALVKFAAYLDPICDALYFVREEVKDHDQTYLAYKVLKGLSYDFAFGLLLMQDVLSVTNELSLALDRKYVDAENCMALLQEAKQQLQVMRDKGWTSFLNKVGLFCSENEFDMPNMGAKFEPRPRLRGNAPTMTNLEHYHIDFFEKVINIHLNEFDKRFSKQSSSLFVLSSCLNPHNSFQAFDKEKLLEYARLYPSDFSDSDIATLDLQLEAFVADLRSDVRFREMSALSELSVKMVETGKATVYPLVYLLLKLALILPGTPATAKTASSAIKFIDSTMQEEPCNQWISDCLLLFLERDIFENVTNDAVIASL